MYALIDKNYNKCQIIIVFVSYKTFIFQSSVVLNGFKCGKTILTMFNTSKWKNKSSIAIYRGELFFLAVKNVKIK